jgi:hypothetical protein
VKILFLLKQFAHALPIGLTIGTHSLSTYVLVKTWLLVYIDNYKPCHMSLKSRCSMKKSDHYTRTTHNIAQTTLIISIIEGGLIVGALFIRNLNDVHGSL